MGHDQRDGKSIGRLPRGIGHTQWGVWSAIRTAKLWQALLLSMDGEPRDWDKRGQELGESFLERSEIAVLHIEAGTLPLLNRDRERPQESTVSLAAFVKWAHGLGWELPKEFRAIAERQQSPTISKAPKPITPLSGRGWAPPSGPEPARWDLWRLIPKCKLWEAVCLSLDVEPADSLAAELRRGRAKYSRLPDKFWDRLKACQANVAMAGPIRPQALYAGALDSPYVPVLLSDVAGFLASAQLPMPSPMRGLTPTDPASVQGDMQALPIEAQPTRREGGRRNVNRLATRRDDLAPAMDKARKMADDPSDYAAVWNAFLSMATNEPRIHPLQGVVGGAVKYRTVEGFKSITRDAFIKRLKYADKRE